MILVDIEKIEEVWICFDWSTMIIPKNYVKQLMYRVDEKTNAYFKEAYRSNDDSYKYCEKIILNVDLNYIKSHKYYIGNDVDGYRKKNVLSDSEITIFERLQNKDVWNINIIFKSKRVVTLNPPTYRKNYYCDCFKYIMADDAENVYEFHKIDDDVFKMEWISHDVDMSLEEIRGFFKKANLTQVNNRKGDFAAEFYKHILFLNKKEDWIIVTVKDSKFKKRYRAGSLLDLKNGYEFMEKYETFNGYDLITLNACNSNYNWNIKFVLILDVHCKEDVYKLISEDERQGLSKTILIFKDNNLKDIFMNDYNDKETLEDYVLFSNVQDINDFWKQYREDNYLL